MESAEPDPNDTTADHADRVASRLASPNGSAPDQRKLPADPSEMRLDSPIAALRGSTSENSDWLTKNSAAVLHGRTSPIQVEPDGSDPTSRGTTEPAHRIDADTPELLEHTFRPLLAHLEAECRRVLSAAQTEAEAIRSNADDEGRRIVTDAHRERSSLLSRATARQALMYEEAESEIQRWLEELDEERQSVLDAAREEAGRILRATANEADMRANARLEEVEREAERMVEDARAEAGRRLRLESNRPHVEATSPDRTTAAAHDGSVSGLTVSFTESVCEPIAPAVQPVPAAGTWTSTEAPPPAQPPSALSTPEPSPESDAPDSEAPAPTGDPAPASSADQQQPTIVESEADISTMVHQVAAEAADLSLSRASVTEGPDEAVRDAPNPHGPPVAQSPSTATEDTVFDPRISRRERRRGRRFGRAKP